MNPPGLTLTPFGASVFQVGSSVGIWRWTSLHDLLFNGSVDEITRRRKSLFSNTLVLPGFDALEAAKIDPKKLNDGSVKYSLVLRGRYLESSVFSFADLRKVDFSGSNLQGSSFLGSKVQGAFLDNAQLQGAQMSIAQLQEARLSSRSCKEQILCSPSSRALILPSRSFKARLCMVPVSKGLRCLAQTSRAYGSIALRFREHR